MPTPFETLVRPFALPDPAPAQIDLAPNAQQLSQAPITLFFGKVTRVGQVRIFNGSYQETVTSYMDKADVEVEAEA
jgi:hypothetical protein